MRQSLKFQQIYIIQSELCRRCFECIKGPCRHWNAIFQPQITHRAFTLAGDLDAVESRCRRARSQFGQAIVGCSSKSAGITEPLEVDTNTDPVHAAARLSKHRLAD